MSRTDSAGDLGGEPSPNAAQIRQHLGLTREEVAARLRMYEEHEKARGMPVRLRGAPRELAKRTGLVIEAMPERQLVAAVPFPSVGWGSTPPPDALAQLDAELAAIECDLKNIERDEPGGRECVSLLESRRREVRADRNELAKRLATCKRRRTPADGVLRGQRAAAQRAIRRLQVKTDVAVKAMVAYLNRRTDSDLRARATTLLVLAARDRRGAAWTLEEEPLADAATTSRGPWLEELLAHPRLESAREGDGPRRRGCDGSRRRWSTARAAFALACGMSPSWARSSKPRTARSCKAMT